MDEIESNTQPFIVKIWVEDRAKEAHPGVWRGYITHASSGKRYYLRNLEGIEHFIAPYLEEIGVRRGKHWGIKSWFKRLLGPH
jgi:hypothetical protein